MFTEEIYSDWMRENQMNKYKYMKSFLPEMKGNVLDVGIGPGWFEKYFEISAVGIDVDKNSRAKVLASGDFLPFGKGIFDFVICLDTIHLIEGKDISRVLKKGGTLLVTHFVSKGNEGEVEKTLLNMFPEFKLLRKELVGEKEKDIVLLLKK